MENVSNEILNMFAREVKVEIIEKRLSNLPDDEFLTPSDVADIFGVTYWTVKGWMRTGLLKKDFQVGQGPIRISKESVLRFFRENSNV
jgi:hypothetical protein